MSTGGRIREARRERRIADLLAERARCENDTTTVEEELQEVIEELAECPAPPRTKLEHLRLHGLLYLFGFLLTAIGAVALLYWGLGPLDLGRARWPITSSIQLTLLLSLHVALVQTAGGSEGSKRVPNWLLGTICIAVAIGLALLPLVRAAALSWEGIGELSLDELLGAAWSGEGRSRVLSVVFLGSWGTAIELTTTVVGFLAWDRLSFSGPLLRLYARVDHLKALRGQLDEQLDGIRVELELVATPSMPTKPEDAKRGGDANLGVAVESE